MEQWEQPYMAKLAEVACRNGGRVLEVGFGLGLSATAIQSHDIEEHIIIEANEGVIARGQEWAKEQPHKVTFIKGLWQDVVASLPDDSLDGVLYDTYPLNKEEQHDHQFKFIKEVFAKVKKTGVLTYCNLTSLGVLRGEHPSWGAVWRRTQVGLFVFGHLKMIFIPQFRRQCFPWIWGVWVLGNGDMGRRLWCPEQDRSVESPPRAK